MNAQLAVLFTGNNANKSKVTSVILFHGTSPRKEGLPQRRVQMAWKPLPMRVCLYHEGFKGTLPTSVAIDVVNATMTSNAIVATEGHRFDPCVFLKVLRLPTTIRRRAHEVNWGL